MASPTHDELRAPRTRTGTAWGLAAAGTVGLLLMLVFIFQNSQETELKFLWLEGSVPVGAAMLLAAVIGAGIVVCLGAGRLLQHRLAERRHRRTADTTV